MSKFEWMELEALSNEIAHLQSRLDAARATKNHGMVKLLEGELAHAVRRRSGILAAITKGLDSSQITVPKPRLIAVQERPSREPVSESQPFTDTVQPIPTPVTSGSANETEGNASMWEKLSAADLERIKRGIATRRAEMLARHAEELKSLDTEQAEIDTVEQAIAAFTQKFKLTKSTDGVPLVTERVPVPAG